MKTKFKLKYLALLIGVVLMGCSQGSNSNSTQDTKEVRKSEEETTIEESSTVEESSKVGESNMVEESENNENPLEENTIGTAIISDTNIQQTNENLNNQEQEVTQDINSMETKIVVYKSKRRLELWQNGEITKEYSIGLGKKPEGKKEQEGDKMTPEGEYYVCTKNQYSKFYLALGLSYPNIDDAKNGLDKGLIDQETYNTIETAINKGQCPPWNTALGGEIMIHGHGGSEDWTKGCIAVDDEVMDVLWEVCSMGTKIIINP